MESFPLTAVAIYTEVGKPDVERWIARGWVKPAGAPVADGTRELSRIDLYQVAFLKAVRDSGFSRNLAAHRINIYALCQAQQSTAADPAPVAIAFSRTLHDNAPPEEGAWVISPALDRSTGWDSLNLIGERLRDGADDVYVINFSRLRSRIDRRIAQALG